MPLAGSSTVKHIEGPPGGGGPRSLLGYSLFFYCLTMRGPQLWGKGAHQASNSVGIVANGVSIDHKKMRVVNVLYR